MDFVVSTSVLTKIICHSKISLNEVPSICQFVSNKQHIYTRNANEMLSMIQQVDSYHFISGFTKRMIKNWIKMEALRPIPWTPLAKPLSQCTVALLSSGGIAMKGDMPFDQEGERRNPWWGDPSYRILSGSASDKDVGFFHLHVDVSDAQQDLNCLLPIQRLNGLAQGGEIGSAAPRHYSIMGYNPQPRALLEETTPKIIAQLRSDGVDAILLAPA